MELQYKDLIGRMSLEEKARMMSGKNTWETCDYEKYGIPSMVMSDGPHGMRRQAGAGDHLGLNPSLPATCFPTAATTANSWNEELAESIGEALGREAVSMGVNMVLGPGLNIKRSPLGGRNFEYFSEDPYLSGKMAAAYIRGIQKNHIAACPKHFAANSQETRRMANDSIVDERAFREIYLTAFEIAVREGGAKAVMSAYNAVNGVYANEDGSLLKGILREEWGFDGIVVSDWGGSNDHALGVINGSHLEMPGTGNSGVKDILRAVKDGSLPEEVLDERLDELLRVVFDTEISGTEEKTFDKEAHHDLARRALEESIVLLKNEGGILPVAKGADIAVIGEFAGIPRYQGAGSSLVNPAKEPETIVDILDQKKEEYSISYEYAQGYRRNKKTDPRLLNEAVDLAKRKKLAIIFAGLDEVSESEGQDRSTMRMPASQCELIEAVCAVNPNVIVVLAAGSAVEMPWCDKVKGILHGYLWGQAGASAVINVLTGKVCPSGKLNETYPVAYEDTPCYHYFPGKERTSEYRESLYVGYRYYDTVGKKVRFPFGFGLSYTTFRYSDLKVTEDEVSIRLKNVGETDGAEVVQLYIGKRSEYLFRPAKELKGFRKVFLKAGEEKEVRIGFDEKSFRYFDAKSRSWQTEGGEYRIYIGAGAADIRLEGSIYRVGTQDPETYGEGKRSEMTENKALLPHYFSGQIENVPDEEFRILYGRPVPDGKWGGQIGMNDAVCQLYYGKSLIGKALCAVLKRIIHRSEKKGVPNLNALFIYNMPIRGFAKMLGGAVTMDMSRALVEIANGHRWKGTGKLIKAWADRKKLY